ncbi:MAG: enoyl-CoA hydratase/isomerase family protein [Leptospirales bacterium]|nr:enoyl-CoA hydratase/isomerase family protein [Leptospirales bacterium]
MAASELPLICTIHDRPGGRILQITINRPQVHNCINGEAAKLFVEAWRKFKEDDSLLVCVLHGAGDKAFCSGADLSALDELVNIYASDQEIAQVVQDGLGPLGGSRIVQSKPVIAVSQGYTYAGGLELFCHGHIRIAERQALFSVACRRWGVPLVDGGTVYLPRLLGWGSALPLIITGQRIRASRAMEIGLIWEICSKGRGLGRAMRIAEQICEQPRDALLADLQSALRGWHLPLEDALRLESENLYPVIRSASMRQGVDRFNRGDRFWFV